MQRDWVSKLFIERSDLFMRLLNQRWPGTEKLVDRITKVLDGFGVKAGHLLDLCCGNGRVSINMAKKGFRYHPPHHKVKKCLEFTKAEVFGVFSFFSFGKKCSKT